MKKSGLVLFFAIFIALFAALITPRVLYVQSLQKRSSELEIELKKLRTQNTVLEGELKALREDPVFLEKVARSQFNKAKEGEIVYKVVRTDTAVKGSGAAKT